MSCPETLVTVLDAIKAWVVIYVVIMTVTVVWGMFLL